MLPIAVDSVDSIGEMCPGHASNQFEGGDSPEEILQNLRTRFCGCTHVSGNIRVHLDSPTPISLTEDDFNLFYHLEQVYGHIFLDQIPRTPRIIFPNLRLIRGEELLGGFALILRDLDVDEFLMPKLTEITRGNVRLDQQDPNLPQICSLARVNWRDIIEDPSFENIDSNSCINPSIDGMVIAKIERTVHRSCLHFNIVTLLGAV